MTNTQPTDEGRIAQAAEQVRTGLATLLQLGPGTAEPDAVFAVLRTLWTRHGSDGKGILQHLTALLDAAAESVAAAFPDDRRTDEAAGHIEESAIVLEDTAGGDYIERAQLLLAEMLLERDRTADEPC
ncbi:hypothetical protein ACFWXO_36860 [Kitasatospora sp. NPDC059088]|uniref:hypothetical protein n=1 Tax=Kitasatospora sp. NPDC059088 TaxID=3346722 RepID=UPI0036954390